MEYTSFFLKNRFLTLTLLLFIAGCVNVFKLSDLRTTVTLEEKKETQARTLLTKMGKAHGIESWRDIKTYTVKFNEKFYGFVGQQENPFKNEMVSLTLSYIPNTNNGQIEILNGRETGYIWGIQDNQAYTIFNDVLTKTTDPDVRFWVPNYQYFVEFPKRIQSVTSVAYAGKKKIDSLTCEGVLASWKTLEPKKDVNQYLVWIDSITKRIVRVDYTKRAINNFVTESAYFNNYNDYNGLLLPAEFEIRSNLLKKRLLHKMSIYGFNRDYMKINSLLPLHNE